MNSMMQIPFRIALLTLIFVASSPAFSDSEIIITEPTYIGPNDENFTGAHVIVDGTELTIDGGHDWQALELINNATLTHSLAPEELLHMTTGALSIEAGSKIDVTGKGAERSGDYSDTAGGSYGGWGAKFRSSSTTNPPFGSTLQPSDWGVAGSTGEGGGAIRIVADELQLDGEILADGTPGGFSGHGGGSGGSIWLEAGILSGSGSLSARGAGRPNYSGAGGGGGRIAIYYDQLDGFGLDDLAGRVLASGGQTSRAMETRSGGPGTVYFKRNDATAALLQIDNGETGRKTVRTEVEGGLTADLVVVNSHVLLSEALMSSESGVLIDNSRLVTNKPQVWNDLQLLNGSIITHDRPTDQHGHLIELTLGSLVVDSSSVIDVTGKGTERSGDYSDTAGGSYGGWGAKLRSSSTTNPPFGSTLQPSDWGVAGSTGEGGGAIRIVADELQLDGEILADGTPGGFSGHGGGSGGSIWLEAGILSGSGSLSARGGGRPSYSGAGGGGGRIAIYYDQLDGFGLDDLAGRVLASGGQTSRAMETRSGGPGTVYFKRNDATASLLQIDNGETGRKTVRTEIDEDIVADLLVADAHAVLSGVLTPVHGDVVIKGSQLVVMNGHAWNNVLADSSSLVINEPQSWNSLQATNNSLITHDPALDQAQYALDLTLGSLIVDSSSVVDVTGKGTERSGDYSDTAGGSYGGWGAKFRSSSTTNPPFGSTLQPSDWGVAGSTGEGGGAIRIVADELQLDGEILADGTPGGFSGHGGGSGGSIWLEAGILSGSGSLSARGAGRPNYSGAGGGGGRIAVYYDELLLPDVGGQVIAAGGATNSTGASRRGGAGSIYLKENSASFGVVRYDNHETGPHSAKTEITASTTDHYQLANVGVNIEGALDLNQVSSVDSIVQNSDLLSLGGLSISGGSWHAHASLDASSGGELEVRDDGLLHFSEGSSHWDSVAVDAGVLITNAAQQWPELRVINGGVVTHDQSTSESVRRLDLTLDTLLIDTESALDVTGKGRGRISGISSNWAGGSHGGRGGTRSGYQTNAPFGNLRQPADPGVGGSSHRGGGVIRLDVGSATVNGQIVADGHRSESGNGFPSGGSVWLTAGQLSGGGWIGADGGYRIGSDEFVGGSGGRVAVYYDDASGFDLGSQVGARGGASGTEQSGGAGTIYLRQNSRDSGLVKIDNRDTGADAARTEINEPVPEPLVLARASVHINESLDLPAVLARGAVVHQAAPMSVDSLTLEGAEWHQQAEISGLDGRLRVRDSQLYPHADQFWSLVELHDGGVLTHVGADDVGVQITANRMLVHDGGMIDVTARGLPAAADTSGVHGGSYGGLGGEFEDGVTNPVYGDAEWPSDPGTGGSSGFGGGKVHLVTDELVIDGVIRADGDSFDEDTHGGGSGGSILISSGLVSGSGSIEADGGNVATGGGGGGGGGRVAVHYGATAGPILDDVGAAGGSADSGAAGEPGTIHLTRNVAPPAVVSFAPDRAVNQALDEFDIHFSQPIDSDSIGTADVMIEGSDGTVLVQELLMLDPARWRVVLEEPIGAQGEYAITVGPDILSTHGQWMDQSGNGDGSAPGTSYSGLIELRLDAPDTPVVESHLPDPEVNIAYGETTLVHGQRSPATDIVVNDQVRALSGSEDWMTALDLPAGYSQWHIEARDAAGNRSEVTTLVFFRPADEPAVTGMDPETGSCLEAFPDAVRLFVHEPSSGFDLEASTRVVSLDSTPIAGSWVELDSVHEFTPDDVAGDGYYEVHAELVDNAGQVSPPFDGHFLVDSLAPGEPTVSEYPSETSISSVVISGTKPLDSGIWVDGEPSVAVDDSDQWEYTLSLVPGDNTFAIEARDCTGNASDAVIVEIYFDDAPPGPVPVTVGQGADGRSVVLEWTQYDEEENGGHIDYYTVYQSGEPFDHVSQASIVGNTQAGQQQFTVSDLAPFETYHFAVVATDTAGKYDPEVSSTAITLEDDVPPEDATDFEVVQSLEQALELKWISSEDSIGDLSAYRLYIDDQFHDEFPTDITTVMLEGLEAATGYSLRLTAIDEFGNESEGAELPAATLLENPSDLSAEPAYAGGYLDWSASQPQELVVSYQIYVDETDFSSVDGMVAHDQVDGAQTDMAIDGLQNGQTYYVAVTARNISGGEKNAVVTTQLRPENIHPPEDVTNLAILSLADSLEVSWTPSSDSEGDLAGYRVYVDAGDPIELEGDAIGAVVENLERATAHEIRVTAFDTADNESEGRAITGVTWLENPPELSADMLDSGVDLSWSAVEPQSLIHRYAVYVSEASFSDISGMEPAILRDSSRPYARLSGLSNGQTYYVAVTTRNLSGGEDPEVSPIAVEPEADADGPEISELQYRGELLQPDTLLVRSGEITLRAVDESGVARVSFASEGALDAADSSGGSSFGAWWPLEEEGDGANTLTVVAVDTLGNTSELSIPVEIELAPPPAPAITSPASGHVTNQTIISVEGVATEADEVQLYLEGEPASDWLSLQSDASFTATVALAEGENTLTAVSRNNRGLEGPASEPVVVTLDTGAPDAPTGLSAEAREAGVIRIRWMAGSEEDVIYHVYRATEPFDQLSAAARVNSEPVTDLMFDDATPSDQRFYYRVVAESSAGNTGVPSEMVDAVADRVAPRATEIVYDPEGAYDPDTGRFGPGNVSLSLEASEPLATTPFLSITPEGGVPMAVSLFQTGDLVYQGSFEILSDTVSATAWAVFSAHDQAGNRGTEVDDGETIEIDTDGPDVQTLAVEPEPPIHNDGNVTVEFDLELTEPVTGDESPRLEYNLSSQPDDWFAVDTLSKVDEQNWSADFLLPASAGQFEAETLSLRWHAEDDLGNAGDRIHSVHEFQVYQDELPPLDPPGMLDAWPLPAGQAGLMWSEVDGAAAYEIWRRDPGEEDFLPVTRVFELDYIDTTPADDDYEYTVVSVRQDNDQEAVSGPGPIREVTTDSIAPEPPTGLTLQMVSSGIGAQWEASDLIWPGDDELVYNLYRSEQLEIVDVSGLEPVVAATEELQAVDADPEAGEHTYAVTAQDAAGNESIPSGSEYLNFDLLPVSGISIERFGDGDPVVAWTHDATTLAGFDLYAHHDSGSFRLNSDLLADMTYVDSGYSGGERGYEVIAVDDNGQESLGRLLLLPDIDFELLPDVRLRKGLINGVEIAVHNHSEAALDGLTLRLDLAGREHLSGRFSLEGGQEDIISVPVPGYPELGETVAGEIHLEYRPDSNEQVILGRHTSLPVESGGVIVTLMTDTFTRGGAGRVRARIENPGDETIEAITARSHGSNPSPDIRIKLLNEEDQVLNARSFSQYLGGDVVTLPDGYTVARIPAGGSWTSQWQDILVPASAPDDMRVVLEIDNFYHAFGEGEQELVLSGLQTSRETTLVDTSYYGELNSVSPGTSYGADPIQIQGRAIERATDQPISDVPLNLVISSSGFERELEVMAEDGGEFSHLFHVLPGESGIYDVSVVHPEILDRPVQGSFTVEQLSIQPGRYDLRHPYDTSWTIPIEVSAGAGTEASNVHFEYRAEDQVDGVLIPGLDVDVSTNITRIESGQTWPLEVTLQAGSSAPESGTLYLRLTSDEAGGEKLAMLVVNFQFTSADPVLMPDPELLNFGLSQGQSRSDTVRIANVGFDDARDVTLTLRDSEGQSAPDWISMGIDGSPGIMAVGEHVDVPVMVSPPSDLPSESEIYQLEVTASNHPTSALPVNVAVTSSEIGSALFHVRNMYTATIDGNGQVIEGLEGARVRLQDEIVLMNVHEGTTDQNGEILFEDIPAGRYRFRISAPNHEAATGRINIQPGITESESVFLSYNLVDVEWSVTETTVEDVYEIDLNAVFETNVPAAVLAVDPAHRTIPDMEAGDVLVSQFELTNHGLIQAIDLEVRPPEEDEYFRYELMAEIPPQLAAQESIIVPYRMVAKQEFPPTGEGAGGCFSYREKFDCPYGYICPDSTKDSGLAEHFLSRLLGDSCGGDGSGSSGSSGGAGGGSGWGGGGAGGMESGTSTSIGGTTCAPDCEGIECCGSSGPGAGGGDGTGGNGGPADGESDGKGPPRIGGGQ